MAVRRTVRKEAEVEMPMMYDMPMKEKSFWDKAGPFMAGLMVIMIFVIGLMWGKLSYLDKYGVPGATGTPTGGGTAAAGTGNTAGTQQAGGVSLDTIKKLFSNSSLIRFGDAKRKALFVDVTDPSCPYCHVAAGLDGQLNKQIGPQFTLVADGGTYVAPVPEMRKLVDQGKAAYVYIYDNGHGNGEMGAKALYCANESGKYWDVHDLLMSQAGYDLMNGTVKNDKTKSGDLANFLAPVFSDVAGMKNCLDSGKYDAQLQSDMQLAQSLGVNGTPGFFVNATNFAGAYGWKDMQAAVDAALK